MRRWRGLAITLMLAAATHASHAERFALLVGVSAYPHLAPHQQLQGPANDVRRMREALLLRGFEPRHLRVLADGVDGAELPLRMAILGALDELAGRARPGDTVLLHFSGHGSQQPGDGSAESAREEPDGWHETFLPRDVRGWDGRRGVVENAITDSALRAAVDRISDRGAFVWAIFDSCHSATLVRGQSDDAAGRRLRQVLPADLGANATPPRPPRTLEPRPAATASAGAAARSPAVYFYAAQSSEPTFERPMPEGAPDAVAQGVFSYVLARALAAGTAMTYRQLGQHVLAHYAQRWDSRVTPLFTGDGLDRPVLDQMTVPVRQWPLMAGPRLGVAAGALEGLAVGAQFEVLPDPLAPLSRGDERPLLRVTAVHPGHSDLEPTGSTKPPAARAHPTGTYLRLVANPPSFLLRLAVDRSACRDSCPLDPAVALLRRDAIPGVDTRWLDARDADADVTLELRSDGLRYRLRDDAAAEAPSDAPFFGWKTASGDAPATVALRIADDLHRLARERNLLQLAARLALAPPGDAPVFDLQLLAPGSELEGAPLTADRVTTVRDRDRLGMQLRNSGPRPLDVTLLTLDANHGIQVQYPKLNGESNRLDAGANLRLNNIVINARRSSGTERLLLIWAPARKQADRRDFSFLQQAPLARTRGQRADGDADVQALLDACFAAYLTRAGDATAAPPSSGLGMRLYTVRVER